MKNIHYIVAAGLLATAITLTGASCRKKEQVAAPTPPSSERQEKVEEAKRSVAAAREVFVARVNGADITLYDLIREMNRIAPRYVKTDEKAAPEITAKIKKEALDNLVFAELAVQEATRQGILVSPERIDQVVAAMKKQTGSAEAYQKYLEGLGITENELRKRIERGHRLELITAREIYQKVKAEDKDLRAEYEKSKGLLKDASGRLMSYEEAAPIIKRKLTAEIGAEMMKAWGNALRAKAKIEIAKEER